MHARHQFKNIGLIARANNHSVNDTLEKLYQYLTDRGLNVIFDEDTARVFGHPAVQAVSQPMLGEVTDLVIVVGGDGSLLHAAHTLVRHNTPVLGVNRGRLGFLTDVSPSELEKKLDQVLQGDYTLDRRFLLQTEIRSSHHVTHEAIAFNDIVLHAGKSVQMLEFELYIDGQFVYRQHSDGLIVSTPTGSTAYALSGGGPILTPNLDAIGIVPMHPHTLSSRPIVVSGDSEITIHVTGDRVDPMISTDGQPGIELSREDSIHIRKYPFKLTLLHPPGYDFYAACRTKLGWSQPLEQHKDEYNSRDSAAES